jgi:hypothetical protein
MQSFGLEYEEASIVLVGSLNPAIFHPEWLLRHNLITEDDLKGAGIEIVHRDLSKFSLDWLKVDVTRDKFIARTNDPSKYIPLNDLMISTLKILEHIPIIQMGMNLKLNYKIDSEESWHKIGDNLAPKKFWDTLPGRVGLKSIDIECARPDELKGFVRIAAGSIRKDYFGVNFSVNNHTEIQYNDDGKEIVEDATIILADHWEKSLEFARTSCENVLSKALEI